MKYEKKLESMRQVLTGLNMLYNCTVPSDEFEIQNDYFIFLNIETKKLILGKLYIILADSFYGKKNKNNTISFKILINDILKSHNEKNTDKLKDILKRIELIDEKYKEYRDKTYAHIDLNEDGTLRNIKDYNISNKDIDQLMKLSEDAYDALLLFLNNASSDHMKHPIELLSRQLWNKYEELGLVKKY